MKSNIEVLKIKNTHKLAKAICQCGVKQTCYDVCSSQKSIVAAV